MKTKERLLELLADDATAGLNPDEKREIDELVLEYPEFDSDESFELAAAAFQMASLEEIEEMPADLQSQIAADSARFFESSEKEETVEEPASTIRQVQFEAPKPSFMQWLGWAVAGAACLALAVNVWYMSADPAAVAVVDPPKSPTVTEKRETLLASAGLVKTDWESPQEDLDVKGDVVWDNSKQEGYMTFEGLPVNDVSKEQYQLWIFDETQDEATPVDGGVFDVDKDGRAVIPITAKLKVGNPKMFAVTVEKPGGVVVSKREKIVALAKV